MTITTQSTRLAAMKDPLLLMAVEQSDVGAALIDGQGVIKWVNAAFSQLTGDPSGTLLEKSVAQLVEGASGATIYTAIRTAVDTGAAWSGRLKLAQPDGSSCMVRGVVAPVRDSSELPVGYSVFAWNTTEEARLEAQLAQLQKMEAIGELAAGIAHEINTPIQYVGDNLQFLQGAVGQLFQFIDALEAACEQGRQGAIPDGQFDSIQSLRETLDLDFLREEVPVSVDQALEGRDRVAAIVRAMKEFAHPGDDALTPVDINHAVENTVAVSRGEWKHIAEMVLDIDPALPHVPAFPGSFNQVLLNLVVNAAHAIAEKRSAGDSQKGTISITTRANGQEAVVVIGDSGSGIPAESLHRIFEPFYTTKDVGKGTGQGLALAHAVIVDKMKGRIEVDSTPGEGARFSLFLPLTSADCDE